MGTKIFCIGRNRTGTSSLAKALDMLGFPCFHKTHLANTIITLDYDEAQIPFSTGVYKDVDITKYVAFADHPFDWMYKDFDRWYKGSKFIYTKRDINAWIESKVFLIKSVRGADYEPDVDRLRSDYLIHENTVKVYFEGRDDILYIDICEKPEWEPICKFLGVDVPEEPFPHIGSKEMNGTKKL